MRRTLTWVNLGLLSLWCTQATADATKKATGPLASQPVGAGDFIQMFLGLFFVLGIIFGMAWFIRRMGSFQQASHGALRVLGGLSLGQRERIVLVQVGEQQLLIGLAPGQIRTLHVLDAKLPIKAGRPEAAGGFAERLQSALQGKLKP